MYTLHLTIIVVLVSGMQCEQDGKTGVVEMLNCFGSLQLHSLECSFVSLPNRMTLTQLFYSTRFLMFSHYTLHQRPDEFLVEIFNFIFYCSYWVVFLFSLSFSFSYRFKSSNKLALLLLEISATKSCRSGGKEFEFQCMTEVSTAAGVLTR